MRISGFNGSVRLAAWVFFVALLQVASLPILFACLAVIAVSGAPVRQHWRRLLRRSRWLLLILVVSLALVTPGEYLVPGLPVTGEGLSAALHQLSLLIAMLGAVALLLATTSTDALVGGMLGLLPSRPAVAFRFSQRAALRLALVLRLASAADRRTWRQWLDGAASDATAAEAVTVVLPNWRPADVLAIAGLIGVALFLAALASAGG